MLAMHTQSFALYPARKKRYTNHLREQPLPLNNRMELAMEWLETTALQPLLQQAEIGLEGVLPTNPSSLTLALIGVGTYLLFGWGRRTLLQREAGNRQDKKPQRSGERRA